MSAHSIEYLGEDVPLFFHPHNCGDGTRRTTERSVELALAFRWLRLISGFAIEVGAVTPYYLASGGELAKKISVIIDPADGHAGITLRCSLFNYDFTNCNVLSISTLEHVGTGDYGLPEEDCVDACNKLIRESLSCFITIPLGYNKRLDAHLHSAQWPLTALTVVYRGNTDNNWQVTTDRGLIGRVTYGPRWANGVTIIERL